MGNILRNNQQGMGKNDEQKEIITLFHIHIRGYAKSGNVGWAINFLYVGNIEIVGYEQFFISGFKRPLFPLSESRFHVKATHVIVPFFIGIVIGHPGEVSVKGIAIGNIEWE